MKANGTIGERYPVSKDTKDPVSFRKLLEAAVLKFRIYCSAQKIRDHAR